MLHQISKKITAIAVLFLTSVGMTNAQDGIIKYWTLQECVEHALKNNITVQQQELTTKSVKADFLQSKLAVLPSLNGSATNNWQTGFAINPTTNAAQKGVAFRTNSLGLSSSMTVFNGFQNSNTIRLQESNLRASEKDLENTKNTITLNVCNAFLTVLQNLELRNSAAARIEATALQVDKQKRMMELGSSNRTKYLQLKAQLSTEELALVNADNALNQAYVELWLLIEVKPDTLNRIVVPNTDFLTVADEPRSIDDIFNDYSKVAPDVKAANQRLRSAEMQKNVALGGRSVRLSLNGSISSFYTTQSTEGIGSPNFVKQNIAFTDINGSTNPVYTLYPVYANSQTKSYHDQFDQNLGTNVGLSLALPIFNSWGVNTNVQKATINQQSLKLNEKLTRNNLYRSITTSYMNFKASFKKYAANKENLDANKESFDVAEKQFELGGMNLADYFNVKNTFIRAQADFTQSKFELIFRRKVLDFYSGKPLY